MTRLFRRSAGLLSAAISLGLACSEDVQLGKDFGAGVALPGADAGASGAGGIAAGGALGFPVDVSDAAPAAAVQPNPGVCVPVRCRGAARQCGNCGDDDSDGLADANDPDCLGPCDDSEAELFSGIPVRVTGSCRADCYFDLNAGTGNDCNWSLSCDELQPAGSACSYDASSCDPAALRSNACQSGCLPLVPNGCDCFGCCELPANSGQYIWLGSESAEQLHCELDSSQNSERCRRCTPVAECQNPCGECELCVGKGVLPASCGSGAGPACPPGVTPCEPSVAGACGTTHYCITGCCVPLPR